MNMAESIRLQGLRGALVKIGALGVGSRFSDTDAEEVAHLLFASGVERAFATHPPLVERIREIARREVVEAFDGLAVAISDDRHAFWRVRVVAHLQGRRWLPSAGETLIMGPLGGRSAVSFEMLTLNAVQLAPPGTGRDSIVDGIGRGIGRAAVHELAHQILGPLAVHNPRDDASYEFPHSARASQYYGTLRWTVARPHLERRLGPVTR